MAHPLKKVLILYTGGTLGMDVSGDNGQMTLPDLSPEELKMRLLTRVPELVGLAQCEVEIVCNRDSADVGPEIWTKLAQRILARAKKCEGFVILHGTDTMTYTASALSFLLASQTKKLGIKDLGPVVLTGSQRPLSALRTDARRNLIAAVEAAAMGRAAGHGGVMLFFDRTLFKGNRAHKRSATQFDAFESPKAPPIGEVGTEFRWAKAARPKKSSQAASRLLAQLLPRFCKEVVVLHVAPGFPARFLREQLLRGDKNGGTVGSAGALKGIVLVVFPSGTAPTSDLDFLGFLEAAREKNIPLVAVSEGVGASPKRDAYAASKKLMKAGVHWAGEMTVECAYVKMAYVLAQKNSKTQFKALWELDIAGEGILG